MHMHAMMGKGDSPFWSKCAAILLIGLLGVSVLSLPSCATTSPPGSHADSVTAHAVQPARTVCAPSRPFVSMDGTPIVVTGHAGESAPSQEDVLAAIFGGLTHDIRHGWELWITTQRPPVKVGQRISGTNWVFLGARKEEGCRVLLLGDAPKDSR